MIKHREVLLVFMLFLCVCGSGFSAYQVGDTVTDWTLTDHLGNPVSLSDFAGSVVILNFWQDT